MKSPARSGRRVRRTLHVEKTIVELEPGQVGRLESTNAREEAADGTVTEVEREEVADSEAYTPWFLTGTIRTRTRMTKPAGS